MNRVFLYLAAALIAGQVVAAENAELIRLREAYARSYFTPQAHLRLGKALLENGEELTAFYVLEGARRERFGGVWLSS